MQTCIKTQTCIHRGMHNSHKQSMHTLIHLSMHTYILKDLSLLETHLAPLACAKIIFSVQVGFRIQKGSSSMFVRLGRARAQKVGWGAHAYTWKQD